MYYEKTVLIHCPIEKVFAFLTDPFSLPRASGWTLGIRVTSLDSGGVGTTFQQRVVILGVERRISGVVTEYGPPRVFAFSMTGAGIRAGSARITLESAADGTKLVAVGEIEPRPAFKPFWWIAWPFLRRRWDTSIPNVKRLLEAGSG